MRIAAFPASLALSGLLLLAGCARNDLTEAPAFLGDFALGVHLVMADKAEKVPISRPATAEEWESAMKTALEERFGRYSGKTPYRIEVFVDGYNIAGLSVPVVLSIKSVVAITVHVWDEKTDKKLNGEKGEQLIVLENTTPQTVIGSGLTQTKEKQIENLSFAAVKEIERYFLRHPEWFGLPPLPAATPKDQ